MSRATSAALAAIFLLSIVGCVLVATHRTPSAPRHLSTDSAAAPSPTPHYGSEEQWIVGETAAAIIEMASHLRPDAQSLQVTGIDEKATPDGRPMFVLYRGATTDRIELASHPWAPDAYRQLARTALSRTSRRDREDDRDLVEALLTLRSGVLLTQNTRVSARLADDFANPSHHESAALLLAAFALREASGKFLDTRRTLCRLAAHLAIADALRDGAARSIQGRLADIALVALVGRQRDAAERLDRLDRERASEPVRAWLRALRLRATLDWRVLVNVNTPSLLERLEDVLARSRTNGRFRDDEPGTSAPPRIRGLADLLIAILRRAESHAGSFGLEGDRALPDWGWRRLQREVSVGDGHLLVDATWHATYTEAARTLAVGDDLNDARPLMAALSQPQARSCVIRGGGATDVQVLDRGAWAAFYQRQLAHASERSGAFLRERLSSRERAVAFNAWLGTVLDGMPLYPAVRRLNALDAAEYRSSMEAMAASIDRDPSLVSYTAWAWAYRWPPKGVQALPLLPPETAWFRRRFPVGTMYDGARLDLLWPEEPETRAIIDGLLELSPWNPSVLYKWAGVHCVPSCAEDQLRRAYGTLADYAPAFALQIAYASGDRAPEQMRPLCEVNEEYCWNLADWLLSRDRFDEAAQAFEDYIQRADDTVAVSNRVEWLTRYYVDHKQVDQAFRVANRAEHTGSSAGMRALAGVLYRNGQPSEAAELYRRIRSRYHVGTDLLAYFLREQRRGWAPSPDERRELDELVGQYFPGGGLRAVRLADFTAPPAAGACVYRPQWLQTKAGFRDGDVIVAVDGVHVATPDQWAVVYEASFDHDVRTIVWRDSKYFELTAPLRRYYYGLNLRQYSPAAAAEHR